MNIELTYVSEWTHPPFVIVSTDPQPNVALGTWSYAVPGTAKLNEITHL